MLGVVFVFLKSSSKSLVVLSVSFFAGGGLTSLSTALFSTPLGEGGTGEGEARLCACVKKMNDWMRLLTGHY